MSLIFVTRLWTLQRVGGLRKLQEYSFHIDRLRTFTMNEIPHIRKSHYDTGRLREAFTSTGETCAQALIQNQESLDIP